MTVPKILGHNKLINSWVMAKNSFVNLQLLFLCYFMFLCYFLCQSQRNSHMGFLSLTVNHQRPDQNSNQFDQLSLRGSNLNKALSSLNSVGDAVGSFILLHVTHQLCLNICKPEVASSTFHIRSRSK